MIKEEIRDTPTMPNIIFGDAVKFENDIVATAFSHMNGMAFEIAITNTENYTINIESNPSVWDITLEKDVGSDGGFFDTKVNELGTHTYIKFALTLDDNSNGVKYLNSQKLDLKFENIPDCVVTIGFGSSSKTMYVKKYMYANKHINWFFTFDQYAKPKEDEVVVDKGVSIFLLVENVKTMSKSMNDCIDVADIGSNFEVVFERRLLTKDPDEYIDECVSVVDMSDVMPPNIEMFPVFYENSQPTFTHVTGTNLWIFRLGTDGRGNCGGYLKIPPFDGVNFPIYARFESQYKLNFGVMPLAREIVYGLNYSDDGDGMRERYGGSGQTITYSYISRFKPNGLLMSSDSYSGGNNTFGKKAVWAPYGQLSWYEVSSRSACLNWMDGALRQVSLEDLQFSNQKINIPIMIFIGFEVMFIIKKVRISGVTHNITPYPNGPYFGWGMIESNNDLQPLDDFSNVEYLIVSLNFSASEWMPHEYATQLIQYGPVNVQGIIRMGTPQDLTFGEYNNSLVISLDIIEMGIIIIFTDVLINGILYKIIPYAESSKSGLGYVDAPLDVLRSVNFSSVMFKKKLEQKYFDKQSMIQLSYSTFVDFIDTVFVRDSKGEIRKAISEDIQFNTYEPDLVVHFLLPTIHSETGIKIFRDAYITGISWPLEETSLEIRRYDASEKFGMGYVDFDAGFEIEFDLSSLVFAISVSERSLEYFIKNESNYQNLIPYGPKGNWEMDQAARWEIPPIYLNPFNQGRQDLRSFDYAYDDRFVADMTVGKFSYPNSIRFNAYLRPVRGNNLPVSWNQYFEIQTPRGWGQYDQSEYIYALYRTGKKQFSEDAYIFIGLGNFWWGSEKVRGRLKPLARWSGIDVTFIEPHEKISFETDNYFEHKWQVEEHIVMDDQVFILLKVLDYFEEGNQWVRIGPSDTLDIKTEYCSLVDAPHYPLILDQNFRMEKQINQNPIKIGVHSYFKFSLTRPSDDSGQTKTVILNFVEETNKKTSLFEAPIGDSQRIPNEWELEQSRYGLMQNRYSITSSWDGNYNGFERPGDPDYRLGFVNIIRVDADVNTLSVYSLLEEEPELQFESPIGELIASNSNIKSGDNSMPDNAVESKIKYIKIDETVVGELNYDSLIGYRDRYTQEYTFVCVPNDPKNLKINVSSDTFDTFVYIKDKNDTIIFENDDSNNTGNSEIKFKIDDISQNIVIGVSSFNLGSTGVFTLTLSVDDGTVKIDTIVPKQQNIVSSDIFDPKVVWNDWDVEDAPILSNVDYDLVEKKSKIFSIAFDYGTLKFDFTGKSRYNG